jgi:hypothetical protein
MAPVTSRSTPAASSSTSNTTTDPAPAEAMRTLPTMTSSRRAARPSSREDGRLAEVTSVRQCGGERERSVHGTGGIVPRREQFEAGAQTSVRLVAATGQLLQVAEGQGGPCVLHRRGGEPRSHRSRPFEPVEGLRYHAANPPPGPQLPGQRGDGGQIALLERPVSTARMLSISTSRASHRSSLPAAPSGDRTAARNHRAWRARSSSV